MADSDDSQKTEEPTQKRLDDARKKGQIATSREINHWFMIFGAAVVLMMFAPTMLADLAGLLYAFVERPHAIRIDAAGTGAGGLVGQIGAAVAPMFVILLVAAVAAGLVQAGPLFASESLKPKLEKISPRNGLKRMFSVRAVVDFAKGLAKLAIVGLVAWAILRPDFDRLERLVALDPGQMLGVIGRTSLALLVGILAVMTVIAGLDFLFEKLSHVNRMRMSREEVREEFKQAEGDPTAKARLKQIRRERARRRMMQEVPKADVVITNPTHFAVALAYDQSTMAAPKVVAKGADIVALRIRETAEKHKVPVVENPPLARALFASVDLDDEVPTEHYKVVAEIIGYVMRLKAGRRA